MFVESLFTPDPIHPELKRIRPGWKVITTDLLHGPISWSRFVRGHYHPDHGFLSLDNYRRIAFTVYQFDEGTHSYIPRHDLAWIIDELNQYVVPDKAMAIHYAPGVQVDCIMTGLPLDAEASLPEQCRLKLPMLQ